jgi:2',3'-cyclic-nucleotide 2'-phosphodiesterase (5'-nucleotidase family)
MPDPEILEHIQLYTYELNKRLELTCGFMAVDLEGRFEYLRTEETNMGNWIADVFYTEFDQCDIVIQNAGALRSNMVITAGHLTLKDLANLLPLKDHIVQLKVPGCIVREALENSVS